MRGERSAHGEAVSRINLGKYFNRCMALAFTRIVWPKGKQLTALVDPVEVAHLIFSGRQRGFDGAPPRDPKKLAKRAEKVRAVNELAKLVSPEVARLMEGRDMYALRKTHISWARRLVNFDSVRVQVGRAPRDTDERHYVDMVDAKLSSQAVWDVLTGARLLTGEFVEKQRSANVIPLAAGAENMAIPVGADAGVVYNVASIQKQNEKSAVVQRQKSSEVVVGKGDETRAGEGVRTLDFDLGKVALYH